MSEAGAPEGNADAGAASQDWDWVLSADGATVGARGRGRASTLPAADTLVLVVDAAALGWHAVDLPRVPVARLRAALDGLLEEALLDEAAHLHLALEPGAAPGGRAWVAVLRREPLAVALAALEAAGREVDRVVPAFAPGPQRRGHFGTRGGGRPGLTWCGPDGVLVLPLEGTSARACCGVGVEGAGTPSAGPAAAAGASTVLWSATPAAALAAERWLGAPVPVVGEAEAWLRAAAESAWDLRQFDLAPQRRGLRRGAALWRAWRAPAWRPVRLGLASLVALQVLGLNAWAWHQERAVAQRQQAVQALLKDTHPQVRVVLDAPLQMQRETELLRARAGQAGEGDLEPALGAAAAAWPEGLGPAQALRFQTGRLVLTVPAWSDEQQRSFRERLRAAGWQAEAAGGRLTLTRAPTTLAGGVTP